MSDFGTLREALVGHHRTRANRLRVEVPFLMVCVLVGTCYGEKKPKATSAAPAPTQADVVEGCLAVRNIVFSRARRFRWTERTNVSGTISNACGHDVSVTVSVEFFDHRGDKIDSESVRKLIKPGDTPFSCPLDSDDEPDATDGKVTLIFGTSL